MVNVVLLGGNLCATPELRYTQAGTAVANLRLAVNSYFRTASGEKRESALFIDVVAWGKSAEACAEYLDKGSKVLIEGELRQREWEDRSSGRKVQKIEVQAKSVRFLTTTSRNGRAAEPVTADVAPDGMTDDVPF